jgi:hypothetical protein
MTRSLASISLSGPATEALERSVKRRRVSNEKEEVKPSFSFDKMFDSLSQEISEEEAFPAIVWVFEE